MLANQSRSKLNSPSGGGLFTMPLFSLYFSEVSATVGVLFFLRLLSL